MLSNSSVVSKDLIDKIKIEDIKVGKRFRSEIGDISELVESIKNNGLLCPITVTKDNLLISGLRRIEAYKKLDIEYIPAHIMDMPLRESGEIDENLVRKNFTVTELLAIKKYRESIESNLQGQRNDLSKTEQGEQQLPGKFPRSSTDNELRRRQERIAKSTGLSYKTLNKVEQVKEAAEQIPEKFGELPHKIDSGRMKINNAWKQVQNHKKRQELIAQAAKTNLSDIVNDSGGTVESTDCEKQITVATTQPASPQLLQKQQTDQDRIGLLYDTNPIRPYSVWNFQLDARFGEEYPGQIPAGIVFNTLYFFTKPGDIVVDPMAGGGVVGDVCKQFDRKCSMYDINPIRPDIQKWDVVSQGFPRVESADLVFWDPPYYKKKEKEWTRVYISSCSK